MNNLASGDKIYLKTFPSVFEVLSQPTIAGQSGFDNCDFSSSVDIHDLLEITLSGASCQVSALENIEFSITSNLVTNPAVNSIHTEDGIVSFKIERKKITFCQRSIRLSIARYILTELEYYGDKTDVGETPSLITIKAKTSSQGNLTAGNMVTITFDSPDILILDKLQQFQLLLRLVAIAKLLQIRRGDR